VRAPLPPSSALSAQAAQSLALKFAEPAPME